MVAAKNNQKSKRSVINLIKNEAIVDLDEILKNFNKEIVKWIRYWNDKEEEYLLQEFEEAPHLPDEIGHIRLFFHHFLKRRLNEIRSMPESEKREALRFLMPFNSTGGTKDFLKHFFRVTEKETKLEIGQWDDAKTEFHILYDVFKIRQTIECANTILKSVKLKEEFPSRFSESEKKFILSMIREVLRAVFSSIILPQYQKELYKSISIDYIRGDNVLERKSQGISYCYPKVISGQTHRVLLFEVYFRNSLSRHFRGELKNYNYNYTFFEILKQEYLLYWLDKRLKNNSHKQEIYQKYEINGQTISSLIEANPSQEIALLKQLPINVFNDLVEQIDEELEDDMKSGIPSLSEQYGALGAFKVCVSEAVHWAMIPLEKLKSLLTSSEPSGDNEDQPSEVQEEISNPIVKKEVQESEWTIKIIKANQVPFFYLSKSASQYKKKLALIQQALGEDYKKVKQLLKKAMESVQEENIVHRRTPKHDRVLPYLIKEKAEGSTREYLFILGGEAKIKPKGMQYTAGDEYSYTPYLIFAAQEADESYGTPGEERPIYSKTFYEYNIAEPAVKEKVLECMKQLRKNLFMSSI